MFDVARRAEEPLRRIQRGGVDTTGQDSTRSGRRVVVRAAEAGDRVKQHDDVLALFDEALGPLDGQFGGLGVIRRRPVEGGGDDLTLHRALHVGDLLGPLVDEDDHEVAFRVVLGDAVRDVLQDRGFARLGRRDDQRTLAFTDRHDQVDDARGQAVRSGLQTQPLVGIQRGQLGEVGTVPGVLDRATVDGVQPDQRVELLAWILTAAFPLFGNTDRAGDGVAAPQAILANHVHRHVDVVRSREVTRGTDERVVVEHVEDARDGLDDIVVAKLGLAATAAVTAALAVAAAPAVAETPAATSAAVVIVVVVVRVVVGVAILLVALLIAALLIPAVLLAVRLGVLLVLVPVGALL